MERNWMKETDGSSEVSAEVMTKSGVWFLSRVGKLARRQKTGSGDVRGIIRMDVKVAGLR